MNLLLKPCVNLDLFKPGTFSKSFTGTLYMGFGSMAILGSVLLLLIFCILIRCAISLTEKSLKIILPNILSFFEISISSPSKTGHS